MKIILISAVFTIMSFSCFSQWTNNVMQNTVVSDSSGVSEATPMMATLNDGSTYISWFEPVPNTNFEFRMQLLDKFGIKQWGNNGLLISNFPQNSALFRYDLKTDLDGNAIVAFQDVRSGHLDIVVYKINVSGSFVWSNNGVALTDPSSTQGLAPTIGITGSNNVIITWNANSGSSKWIAMQKISSSGNIMWASVKQIIDITNVNRYSRPTSVPFGNDDFTLLYVKETGSGLPPGTMLAQHYDTAGTGVWSNPTIVSSYTIPFFFFPVAVSDHQDGFYVAFNTSLPSNPSIGLVYLQHVNASGALWNSFGISTSALPNNHKFTPGALYDVNNYCIYILLKVTDINQSQSAIYMQKVDTGGNLMWSQNAVPLVSIPPVYQDPNAFSLTPSGLIVCYTSGTLPSQTINAVKIDSSGSLLWSGNPVSICSNSSVKDDVAQGIFAQNQMVIVWNDDRNGGGIYAQNINDDGTVGAVTGVDQLTNDNYLIDVFPNPSALLNIYFKSLLKSDALLQISDLSGRIVLSQKINKNSSSDIIQIETNLSNGLYIVHLNADDKLYQKKWLKE